MQFEELLEIDYIIKIADMRRRFGGKFYAQTRSMYCIYVVENCGGKNESTTCLGDVATLKSFAAEKYNMIDMDNGNAASYETAARINTTRMLQSTGHPIVFIDFIDSAPVRTAKSPEYGRVVIEL